MTHPTLLYMFIAIASVDEAGLPTVIYRRLQGATPIFNTSMAQAYTPECNTFVVVWDLSSLHLYEAVAILGGDMNSIACALFKTMLRKLRRLSDAYSGSASKLAMKGNSININNVLMSWGPTGGQQTIKAYSENSNNNVYGSGV